MDAQCDVSTMVFSNSYSTLEYKTCGKIAQLVLIRLEDYVDGLDTQQKSAFQGEENGCKGQSSPVQTQLDNWHCHDGMLNSRPITELQYQEQKDTADILDQDNNSIEDKYQVQHNSDDHDQCSDHNYQYPFEMIVVKPELMIEEEQNVGIVDGGLRVKKEEMEGETLMNDESFSTDSSNRLTIKQEHIKEENEEDLNEVESDGGYNSVSTMMRIQDISPVTDTAIIVNFKTEINSIALNEHDLNGEGIIDQGSSTSNECVNNSPGQLLINCDRNVPSSKSYTCKYCDYISNYKLELTKHLRTHTRERPHICEFCDKAFIQKSHLTTHLHKHTGERPYSCDICDKSFTQKSDLNRHLLTHTGERPYSCEFCDKTFTQKSDLNRHLLTHTGERPYSCEFCDKTFTQKSDLNRHSHTHTGERLYSCDICEKTFTQKSDVNKHFYTHTGERLYSCDICEKTFTEKSNLTRHLNTHTGERPYICEFCDKTFTQKSTLTTHLHTHTGERPYSCEFCNKSFTRKSILTIHLHRHTGERPYSCGNCDKTFTHKSSLTRHLHTHTGE